MGFLGGSEGENLPAMQETQVFDPWVRKIPWRREWQPTSVFLPEEFHGQRSQAVFSPGGCKESDMTEQLNNNKGMYPGPGYERAFADYQWTDTLVA